jgi:hypothetical protein
VLTSAYAGLVDLMYADDIKDWVVAVRYILQVPKPRDSESL